MPAIDRAAGHRIALASGHSQMDDAVVSAVAALVGTICGYTTEPTYESKSPVNTGDAARQ